MLQSLGSLTSLPSAVMNLAVALTVSLALTFCLAVYELGFVQGLIVYNVVFFVGGNAMLVLAPNLFHTVANALAIEDDHGRRELTATVDAWISALDLRRELPSDDGNDRRAVCAEAQTRVQAKPVRQKQASDAQRAARLCPMCRAPVERAHRIYD